MKRFPKDSPFRPNLCAICAQKLPQKLIMGLRSAIFALRAKIADDVSDDIGMMMWWDDVSMMTSSRTEVTWQYGKGHGGRIHGRVTRRYSGRRPHRRMMWQVTRQAHGATLDAPDDQPAKGTSHGTSHGQSHGQSHHQSHHHDVPDVTPAEGTSHHPPNSAPSSRQSAYCKYALHTVWGH